MKNELRTIKSVWKAVPTMDGAGVPLKRAFGFNELPRLDPFLLMDQFRSDNRDKYKMGFPWHPHRGMETITYVLDGDVEHQDSLGNAGVISTGDVQWMTAGSGIIHQEMPQGNAKGAMWGFQLWANLPAQEKMMDPRYREVKAAAIPVVKTDDGATVRLIAGEVNGTKGPVQDVVTKPEYLDVTLPSGKMFTHAVTPGHTAFAYVVEGEGIFDSNVPAAVRHEGDFVLYEHQGDTVVVTTNNKPVRFLLILGKPLKEPIAWYGPIVMNTEAQIRAAFKEYESGTFVKKSGAARTV